MKKKLIRLNAIMKKKNKGKLYLFGAGQEGKELLKYLKRYNISVEAFIDNNSMLNIVEDKKVISPEQFINYANEEDFVLISCMAYEEIEKQLQTLNWNNYMYYREVPDIKEYIIDYDIVQLGNRTCWEKAIRWLLNHKIPGGGISYSNQEYRAYPEVTGYLIPTLIEYGFYEEAKDCMKWLLSIQEKNGGFRDINNTKEFVFDTAQILRGLLCFYNDVEISTQVRKSIKKACEYLYFNMIDFGKKGYIKQYKENDNIPETILLYTLPPFKKAAKLLKREDYLEAIELCKNFYEKSDEFLRITDLTHFLAYEIEALVDLGEKEKAEGILNELFESQLENGAIPSYKNSNWICTPGVAQIALCELKLGKIEHAEKILEWFRSIQMPYGGFCGSYGLNAEYFLGIEISWAVKYYLDAERLYIEKWFDYNTKDFPEIIDRNDARYQMVIEEVKKISNKENVSKIIEIGCGKGRFLKNIVEDKFLVDIDGLDISENLLNYLPKQVKKIHGRMENIPCESNTYDLVFCIEALEHSQNMQQAIFEMVRVLKPGGKLLIIDKDKAYWGTMQCSVWENWIGKVELKKCMENYLKEVNVKVLDKKYPYMLAWNGKKYN